MARCQEELWDKVLEYDEFKEEMASCSADRAHAPSSSSASSSSRVGRQKTAPLSTSVSSFSKIVMQKKAPSSTSASSFATVALQKKAPSSTSASSFATVALQKKAASSRTSRSAPNNLKKQKTLKVTDCSKCGVVMTDNTAHRKPGAQSAHKCPPQCSVCHGYHPQKGKKRNVTCPLKLQTAQVPAATVNESSTPAQIEDTTLAPESRNWLLLPRRVLLPPPMQELPRLPKRLTDNLRIYHATRYTKEVFEISRVMVTLWLRKRPLVVIHRKAWYDNFTLGVLQCLFGRGDTLPQLHRNALSVVRGPGQAKSIHPPGPAEFLHAIDTQFWCVAHGHSYWPRFPNSREADRVLASFSKLQKKANVKGLDGLSESEAKELKKLEKKVGQFELHTMVKKWHSSQLPKLRRELKDGGGKVVLIIDFTKFAMGNENRAIDLVFVCFYWNATAQCVEWEYIDVVCEGVDIFSDGGPNHFKISSTIAFFTYHGSSLCDGHAAVIHHVLNAMAFNEDKPWHTVDELIAAIKKRCSRVFPIKLDRVPTPLELPRSFEVKTLEGIRSRFFFFEAVRDGVVSIRSRFGAPLCHGPPTNVIQPADNFSFIMRIHQNVGRDYQYYCVTFFKLLYFICLYIIITVHA
eukprot:g14963.t1